MSREHIERKRVRRAWILAAVYAFLMANWLVGHLRFTNPACNSFTLALALLLPPIAAALPFPLISRGKVLGFILLLLASLVSLPPLALAAIFALPTALVTGKDATCDYIRTIPAPGPPIRVYLTHGGAMTSFGIVVQQERTILPGLIWVTSLSGAYPADDVTVTVLDRHHIRCSYPPRDDIHTTPQVEVVRTD